MRATIKETIMIDGTKAHDINILCNSNPKFGHKVIITCKSKTAAIQFIAGLKRLVSKHTVETVETII